MTDSDQFTAFMRNYQNMVYTTAYRLLADASLAEDVSQEVFLKAYHRREMLYTSATAGGWLKTVARNLCLNLLARDRKRWRFFSEFRFFSGEDPEADPRPALPIQEDQDTLRDDVESNDDHAIVEKALLSLPDHQRIPLILFHFDDLSYQDIARSLGVSLSKVKTDIMRGRQTLAASLGPLLDKESPIQ